MVVNASSASVDTGQTCSRLSTPKSSAIKLTTRHVDTRDELLRAIEEREIVTFEAKRVIDEGMIGRPLSYWKERHPGLTINLHGLPRRYVEKVERYFENAGDDAVMEFMSLPQGSIADAILSPRKATSSLRELIDALESGFDDLDPDESFTRSRVNWAEMRRRLAIFTAYGVVNTKETAIDWKYPDFFERWRRIYSFLWFGLSPGGTHLDYYDNMLMQLSGRKVILVYDREFMETIDGHHYVKSFDPFAPLSEDSVRRKSCLAKVPYHRVELRTGVGVTIPSLAYHAPRALSRDSVSLNTFMIPHIKDELPGAASRFRNMLLESASRVYEATGLKLLKFGPYELY